MSIPPPIQQEPSAETNTSPPPSSQRLSRSCKKILSWRGFLIYLAVLMVIIIVIGLLATAHTYYHEMGGFGWLKSKREMVEPTYRGESILEPQICLPSRRFAIGSGSISPPHITGRSPANVPYYTCGDQQNSCEAYGHPEICCPVQMICQPTFHTTSGVYCCNGTLSHHECHILRAHARCRPQYHECSADLGGGCCPNTMTCFGNQCIPIFEKPLASNASNATIASNQSTATPLPGVPVPREGEIARGSRLKVALFWNHDQPYLALAFLGFVAAVMGML